MPRWMRVKSIQKSSYTGEKKLAVHWGNRGMKIIKVQGQRQVYNIFETSVGCIRPLCQFTTPKRKADTEKKKREKQVTAIRVKKTASSEL